MLMLDSIIRTLSLTFVDADDPRASIFFPRAVPAVNSDQLPSSWSLGSHRQKSPAILDFPRRAIDHTEAMPQGCSCGSLTLGENWTLTSEHAPLWAHTPAWNSGWTEAEIRKESCRRVCWSSMILAAGHVSYAAANKSFGLDLFVSNPANVCARLQCELAYVLTLHVIF